MIVSGRIAPSLNLPLFWGRDSDLPSNSYMVLFEPPRILTPNGTSINSVVFAGLTNVSNRHTDKQTDRPRYILSLIHI